MTDLKTHAASCNFKEPDRLMRDKVVSTVTGNYRNVYSERTNLHWKELFEYAERTNSLTDK